MLRHLSSAHDIHRPFRCSLCRRRFFEEFELQEHVQRFHGTGTGERPFKCNFCSASFKLKYHCYRHVRNLHGNSQSSDSEITENSVDYDKILRKCDKNFEFKCKKSYKTFNSKREFETDVESNHENQSIFKYGIDRNLNKNLRIRLFRIDDQKQVSSNCTQIQEDHNEKYFECIECSACFHTEMEVQDHIRIVHERLRPRRKKTNYFDEVNESMNLLHCEICWKSYETIRQLTNHMKSHGGALTEDDHSDSCENLKSEFEVNENINLLYCEFCWNSYRTMRQLMNHIKSHGEALTEEDHPDSCENLKDDLEVNETMNLLYCEFCWESFGTMGRLMTHVKSHEGALTEEDHPDPCANLKDDLQDSNSTLYEIGTIKY